jgi:hypothetical protein
MKTLEIPVNRAHLKGWLIGIQPCFNPPPSVFNPWDFVRELFTISRFRAFP